MNDNQDRQDRERPAEDSHPRFAGGHPLGSIAHGELGVLIGDWPRFRDGFGLVRGLFDSQLVDDIPDRLTKFLAAGQVENP